MKHKLLMIPYKLKISVLLTLLIGIIIANCIYSKNNMDHMTKSVTSIYEDRLLASTYIAELSQHLYERQLHDETASIFANDTGITKLISSYELTYLTAQEKQHWQQFKQNIAQHDKAVIAGDKGLSNYKMALADLKLLTQIQAKEGNLIFKEIRSDLHSFTLGFALEIASSIVIGVMVLSFIGFSKNSFLTAQRNPSLN